MPLLKCNDVGRVFGGLQAVRSFNLELYKDELVGLIGPNGAGKTTVFNAVTGVFPPTSGDIHFAGQDLRGLGPYRIAQRGIARTFQNIRLFKAMSVLDNVMTAMQPRAGYKLLDAFARTKRFQERESVMREEAESLLERFGLADRRHIEAGSLPYGAQRRLEIARALASAPQLLLLDEPAAGMNPNEVNELVDLIRGVRKDFNVAILLIEHQMGLVMNLCERLVVLDFGEIIAEGTPHEIQNNARVLEAYLGRGATA